MHPDSSAGARRVAVCLGVAGRCHLVVERSEGTALSQGGEDRGLEAEPRPRCSFYSTQLARKHAPAMRRTLMGLSICAPLPGYSLLCLPRLHTGPPCLAFRLFLFTVLHPDSSAGARRAAVFLGWLAAAS
jgi:hypothetical protein